MREILFRGRTSDGRWAYGYLFIQAEGTEYEEAYILGGLDHRDSVYDIWKCVEQVDINTVDQFTGLLDKNGTKIFEGDIVRATMDWGPAGMKESVVDIGFKKYEGYRWNYFDLGTIEVIGNIHDNPKLLEVKK